MGEVIISKQTEEYESILSKCQSVSDVINYNVRPY